MAYTVDDERVKGLQKDTGWDAQRATDWANRYYTDQAVPATTVPTTAPPAGSPTTAGSIPQQAGNASTYSQTPGAAPVQNTTNQGTQDVVRNSYLQQATQGTTIDRNDPNFKQQVDPYNAAVERQKQGYLADAAERMSAKGMGDSGAMDTERRMANERAGEAQGSFESQLVGRELQNRRAEIQNALASLGSMVNSDQGRALQKQLADLDAQLKQAGLSQSGSLGAQELALKDKLGTGGLNIDLMRLLQQGQQFGDQLGFNVADRTAYWNNQALQNLF